MADEKPNAVGPKVLLASISSISLEALQECPQHLCITACGYLKNEKQVAVLQPLDASGHVSDATLEQVWALLTPEARKAMLWLVGWASDRAHDGRGEMYEKYRQIIDTLRLGGIK